MIAEKEIVLKENLKSNIDICHYVLPKAVKLEVSIVLNSFSF